MSYRVLIPTAGTGSRLGNLTRYINKALVIVANRPILSHLIDLFPADAEFVIALGYKGELIREFLKLAYPKRTFFFADVHPFEGPGSGLGLSVLCCRDYLKEPFVFCSCDTLVDEPIPVPDHNWMGYASVDNLFHYRTLRLQNGQVKEICEKGAEGPNLKAYIGLAGVYNHVAFWAAMESGDATMINTGESHGMRALLEHNVRTVPFTWWDTGNPDSLAMTRERHRQPDAPNILDKPNEAIWFVNNTVIKFSADKDFISNRVKRASYLEGFCPQILDSTSNMYKYALVQGAILSEIINLPLFEKLLKWCETFWTRTTLSAEDNDRFHKNCLRFYRDKTEERIQLFYHTFGKQDGIERINGREMPTLRALLDKVDWNWLAEGLPGRFHGDLHFENILYCSADDRFVFLDWRQEFGGSLTTGDIYYDLAKLLHGLIICHELIVKNMFSVEWTEEEIKYDFLRKNVLVECEMRFTNFLREKGYQIDRARQLTALIFLNIAALHHYPYSLLLFCLGKSMLFDLLKKTK
ncbi:MAG: phosphotransferase [Candidatus Theseobacter exili]|nr:phosphotransferase [Candidatus Theseobacter exili]